MQIEFFNFFRSVVQTEDGLVLYALALIVSMEIIDFVTGTIAAIANPDIEYKSKIGINGLLRKILGVLLLMILIPMSVLLPEKTGSHSCTRSISGTSHLLFNRSLRIIAN